MRLAREQRRSYILLVNCHLLRARYAVLRGVVGEGRQRHVAARGKGALRPEGQRVRRVDAHAHKVAVEGDAGVRARVGALQAAERGISAAVVEQASRPARLQDGAALARDADVHLPVRRLIREEERAERQLRRLPVVDLAAHVRRHALGDAPLRVQDARRGHHLADLW